VSEPEQHTDTTETADWAGTFAALGLAVRCSERAEAAPRPPAFLEEQHQLEAYDLAVRARYVEKLEQRAIAEGLAAQERRRAEVPWNGAPAPLAEAIGELKVRAEAEDYSLGLAIYTVIQAGFNKHGVPAGAAYLYWLLQYRARHTGRDKFTVAELRAYLEQITGQGWPERRIRDLVRPQVGLLWREAHRAAHDRRQIVYAMIAKERVMLALEVADPGAYVILADRAWQGEPCKIKAGGKAIEVKALQVWEAHCWDAYASNHPGNGRLARQTLAEGFGRTRRITIHYEKVTHMAATRSVAVAEDKGKKHEAQYELAEQKRPFSWVRAQIWRYRGRRYRRVWHVWQDVNAYRSESTRLASSHRRKHLKARVRALRAENVRISGVDGHPSDQDSSRAHKVTRRFERAESAAEYQEKHPERPALVFYQRPPEKAMPRNHAGHSWQYRYSPQALAM
jgi:hypothetical protein